MSTAGGNRHQDLLIRDARIVPLSPLSSAPLHPVDVIVSDGLVIDIGADLHRPDAEEIQADGRWLMPGIWDQHVHLGQWTLARKRLDLSGTRSPEEVLAIVAAHVEGEPGRPVIALGHRPGVWAREPTVSELDAVTGITPVVLIAGDCHHAWLNSSALAALMLAPREDVVRENEWFEAYAVLGELVDGDGTSPAAYRDTIKTAASQGVVGMVDFEFVGGVDDWVERWAQGCDLIRIRRATYAEGLDDVIERGLRYGDPLIDGDPRLTMGPLKIISDGSLNTRTAWCCQPYADGDNLSAPSGAANLPAHELRNLLARAHMRGLEVATHAIGDAAASAALDAYAATGARGSIEHAQLIKRADLRRIHQLGLRASVQPSHLLDDRDLTELIWPGRGDRCFAFRWMLDEGVEMVLGSDAPVAALDPWLAMAAAVHRSDDDREAWYPEHSLTTQETLAASVDGQHTVHLGSRGDLVLLDHDPLAAEPGPPLDPVDSRTAVRDTAAIAKHLRSMQVALTVVDGAIVHSTL
ncbi:amidohydrolase family protein [Nocardioides salsibiostraticola]